MPNRKHRGSSKAGRPRQPGPRYPGGKLKPPGPNERVLADRARLMGGLGGLHLADHPLDLAHARGWITTRQYKAGTTFARLHAQIRLGFPGLARGGPQEVREGDREHRPVREWGSEVIADVFDRVFDRVAPSRSGALEAEARWRDLCHRMTPDQRSEVIDVCVRASWPQWICQRAAGHMETPWERRRDVLLSGLDAIAAALKKPAAIAAVPVNDVVERPLLPRGPMREEVTDYVTEEGELILKVVRRTRAPDAA